MSAGRIALEEDESGGEDDELIQQRRAPGLMLPQNDAHAGTGVVGAGIGAGGSSSAPWGSVLNEVPKRARTISPPAIGAPPFEYKIQILQADGATAVDGAARKVFFAHSDGWRNTARQDDDDEGNSDRFAGADLSPTISPALLLKPHALSGRVAPLYEYYYGQPLQELVEVRRALSLHHAPPHSRAPSIFGMCSPPSHLTLYFCPAAPLLPVHRQLRGVTA